MLRRTCLFGGGSSKLDNDPKHTAKSVGRWFEDERVPVLPWPSQSPNLNPIENLWNMVDASVKETKPSSLGFDSSVDMCEVGGLHAQEMCRRHREKGLRDKVLVFEDI